VNEQIFYVSEYFKSANMNDYSRLQQYQFFFAVSSGGSLQNKRERKIIL